MKVMVEIDAELGEQLLARAKKSGWQRESDNRLWTSAELRDAIRYAIGIILEEQRGTGIGEESPLAEGGSPSTKE